MSTDLIVHSQIVNGSDLIHNIQSDNLARLKQVKRKLLHEGYEIHTDVRSESGFHTFGVWSFLNRDYVIVPRVRHSNVLTSVGISKNNIAEQLPHLISTLQRLGHFE